MPQIKLNEISRYVEDNISNFHSKKLYGLENLSLKKILRKKIHTYIKLKTY